MSKRARSATAPGRPQAGRPSAATIQSALGHELVQFFWPDRPDDRAPRSDYGTLFTDTNRRRTMLHFVGNFATEKRYQFINCIIVGDALADLNLLAHEAPLVATFNQIKKLGATVRKGSKAVARVCFHRFVEKDNGDRYPVQNWVSVFHHTQCDGLPEATTRFIRETRGRYLGRHLARPARFESDTSGVPSLQEQSLRVLAAQPDAQGPSLDMCRHTTRAWWPALEDASAVAVLDKLVDARVASPTDAWSADAGKNAKGWAFDPATRTLTTPPRQHFTTPDQYYYLCFRTIARVEAGVPARKTHARVLDSEIRAYLYMQEAGLRHDRRYVCRAVRHMKATKMPAKADLGRTLQQVHAGLASA